MGKKLNALKGKQRLFVQEYIKDHNATRAAKAAGYSEKTAKSMGNENLTKPAIVEAIAEITEVRAQELKIDADWVLKELKELYTNSKSMGKTRYALDAIDKIGKHVDVQSWQGKMDITSKGEQVVYPPLTAAEIEKFDRDIENEI